MKRRKLSAEALKFFREAGRKGGKVGGSAGGAAAAAGMTPEQRTARAKKASAAGVKARAAKAKKRAKGGVIPTPAFFRVSGEARKNGFDPLIIDRRV